MFRNPKFWNGFATVILLLAGRPSYAQIGACCLGDASCEDTNSSSCTLSDGDFLGEGTFCESAECTGACCLADKPCTVGGRDDCAAGTFQGPGTACDSHCAGRQGAAITYQGQLKQNGLPVNGLIDIEARLWTTSVGGEPVGGLLLISPVTVINGLFTVELDFGQNAFNGDSRWLEIAVRSPHDSSDTAPYVLLSPRQSLTAAPYALYALNAPAGSSVWSLTGPDAYYDSGNVGIGTQTPAAPLHVEGTALASAFSLRNPDNPSASFALSWLDGVPRIRYGGSGPGNHNGFAIHGTGDSVKLRLLDNGSLGLGTDAPVAKLDVRGRLVLDDGEGGLIYTASSGGGPGRYLRLIHAPDQGSSSGLKAGGVLVSDNYSYADPGSNDLIVKGSVGIGTTSPYAKLTVESDGPTAVSAAATGSSGYAGNFACGDPVNSDTALTALHAGAGKALLAYNYGTGKAAEITVANAASTEPALLVTNSGSGPAIEVHGSVGIGTPSPGSVISNSKLDVVGGHVAVDNNYGFFSYNSTDNGIGAGIDTTTDDELHLYADGAKQMAVTGSGGDGAVQLPTDSISSSETGNEPGLASVVKGWQDAIELDSSVLFPTNIASRTIHCPTDGFVFATATVVFHNRAGNPDLKVQYGLSRVSEDFGGTQYWHEIAKATVFPQEFTDTAPNTITGVFNVSAGDNTFYLVGAYVAPLHPFPLQVTNTHLILVFLPTAYGTVEVEQD